MSSFNPDDFLPEHVDYGNGHDLNSLSFRRHKISVLVSYLLNNTMTPRKTIGLLILLMVFTIHVYAETITEHINKPDMFFSEGFTYTARSLYEKILSNEKTDHKRISSLAALVVVSRKLCVEQDETTYISAIMALAPDNKWAKDFLAKSSSQDCIPLDPIKTPDGYRDVWGNMNAIRQILAAEDDQLRQPMHFYTLLSCTGSAPWCGPYILAIGTITDDTAEQFTRHYEKEPANKIAFHSPGGDLGAGLALGRAVRERKLSSFVGRNDGDLPGNYSGVFLAQKQHPPLQLHFESQIIETPICLSACAYAFLGGVARHVSSAGKFGVHQFAATDDMNEKKAQTITGIIGLYLAEMKVSRDLLQLALWTDPEKMWILDQQQLESLRVVTQRSFSNPSWQLIATDEGKIVAQVSAVDDKHTDREITLLVSRTGRSFTAVIISPLQPKLLEDERYTSQCLSMIRPEPKYKPVVSITTSKQRRMSPYGLQLDDQSQLLFNIQLDRSMVESMANSSQPVKLDFVPANACSPFGFSVSGFSTIEQKSTLMAILRN